MPGVNIPEMNNLAKAKLGWTPKIKFKELMAEMVREDLKTAERDELVKKHGYSILNCHE